jgi:hypothetical protein
MSDGSQLFVKDTECFLFIKEKSEETYYRPTIEEFVKMVESEYFDVMGEHIVGEGNESKIRNIPANTKIWDAEWCDTREFYFVVCYQPKSITVKSNDRI